MAVFSFLMIVILVGLAVLLLNMDDEDTSTDTSTPTRAASTGPDEPFFAPDFTLPSLDNQTYTLSDLRGQWVLLNFWATWCKPCVKEMPVLQQISQDYAGQMQVIGVNVREDTALVAEFIQQNEISYLILLTPPGPAEDQVLIDYLTMTLPQTLVIAPNGEVVWRAFGELALESFSSTLAQVIADWQS
jgi:thiol-disulfide isomerase/thioredoxin